MTTKIITGVGCFLVIAGSLIGCAYCAALLTTYLGVQMARRLGQYVYPTTGPCSSHQYGSAL